MGDFHVKAINTNKERGEFYHAMLRDLEAFDYMLKEGMVEQKSDMIGAEQEMCIVDSKGNPMPAALDILSKIDSEKFTNELALYNLEINLSPQKLTGDCFSQAAKELDDCMRHGREKAAEIDASLFLTGNLPTLGFRHLMFDYMTPEDRYKLISAELLKQRGRDFEVFLQGVDDFQATLDSVLFEACNTSFQLHLQIDPREFVTMHNWAQMISGPVLAAATNSPLLFGKELWDENRIALFKQSLDTRSKRNYSRVQLPRVYFGNDWLRDSPVSLWKADLTRFPVLVRGYGDDDPFESLKNGITPKLKSIRLHNGTTYTWNRLCYGVANNSPHIRIECRYLPAGPTMADEMANFAFWIGLMKGMPEDKNGFWERTDFQVAKSNFVKAARTGLHTVLSWFGKQYAAKDLILDELIPMAWAGLEKMQVDEDNIEKYMGIIASRVGGEQTGADWQRRNFRRLRERFQTAPSLRLLVQQSLYYQQKDLPVHEWQNITRDTLFALPTKLDTQFNCVEDIMTREVVTIQENVTVEVIERIMVWQNLTHLPVEGKHGSLVGMISKSLLENNNFSPDLLARDIMQREVIFVAPEYSIEDAKVLMNDMNIHSLPVVEEGQVVGMLTAGSLML